MRDGCENGTAVALVASNTMSTAQDDFAVEDKLAVLLRRPLSGFMLFAKTEYPRVKEANPLLSPKQRGKIIAAMWDALSVQDKLGYHVTRTSRASKTRYNLRPL